MNFTQIRLVTTNVKNLTRFYEGATGATATVLSSGYVEFQHSPCRGLAIADAAALRTYGEGAVAPAANRSAVLDFEVEDVDAEYERLRNHVNDWVQPPMDRPWGNRAMLFRDPDGNLVNVFATPRGTPNA
jgi:uncharacterized glyoxalase superfamily protein PhnB